jgi:hypothetical protein
LLENLRAGVNSTAPKVFKDELHTFPEERLETVTLANKGSQGVHSLIRSIAHPLNRSFE